MPKNRAYFKNLADNITINKPSYEYITDSSMLREYHDDIECLKAHKGKSTEDLLKESQTRLEELSNQRFQTYYAEYKKVLKEQRPYLEQKRKEVQQELNKLPKMENWSQEDRQNNISLSKLRDSYQKALTYAGNFEKIADSFLTIENRASNITFDVYSDPDVSDIKVGISNSELKEKFENQLGETNKQIDELESGIQKLKHFQVEENTSIKIVKNNVKLAVIANYYNKAKEDFDDYSPITRFFASRLHPFFLPKSMHEAYEAAARMNAYKEILDKEGIKDPQAHFNKYKDRIPAELLEEPKDEEVVNENPEIVNANDRVADPNLTEKLQTKTNPEAGITNEKTEMIGEVAPVNETVKTNNV